MRGREGVNVSQVSLDQRIRGVGSLSKGTCELGVWYALCGAYIIKNENVNKNRRLFWLKYED